MILLKLFNISHYLDASYLLFAALGKMLRLVNILSRV